MSDVDLSQTHIQVERTFDVWNNNTQQYEQRTWIVSNPIHAGKNEPGPWGYDETYRGVYPIAKMQKIGGKYYSFDNDSAADELARRRGE